MPDEFPYSGTQLVDESQPTDGTLGAQLDDAVRENRRALNFLWGRAAVRHFRHVDLVPLTQETSVQGDKIVEFDIAESPHTLVRLTGGFEGQIIYLMVADTSPDNVVILHHNSQYISLADGRDFHMQPGDLVCLRNQGGSIEEEEAGVWVEVFREVAGAILGLISPGRDRFEIGVSDQGALVVTEL